MADRLLTEVKVVEYGGSVTGSYCAKLLPSLIYRPKTREEEYIDLPSSGCAVLLLVRS